MKGNHHPVHMDVVWGYLSSLKLGNGGYKFVRINDVVKTVLILPLSNVQVGKEREKQNSFAGTAEPRGLGAGGGVGFQAKLKETT